MRNGTLLRVLERERAAFATERAHLIDVICHLSGRDWTPPPAEMRLGEPLDSTPVQVPDLVEPDQWPDEAFSLP